jgi:hypothetical protein
MRKYPALIGKLFFRRVLVLTFPAKKLVCDFYHAEFSFCGAGNNIRKEKALLFGRD